jgi:hypothetical protein
MKKIFTVNSTGSYQAKREIINGRDYYVVPMVPIVEGVHEGLGGAFFFPASEIEANATDWNGVPLPIGHPIENGQPVSIKENGFEVQLSVGFVRNSVAQKGKLQAEGCIDIEKAKLVNGGIMVLERIEAGLPLEVSTSMFAPAVGPAGVWNGEAYEATLIKYTPDHIALLPDATGACSIADGCGVRANKNNSHKESSMKKILQMLQRGASQWLRDNEASFGAIREQLSQWIERQNSTDRYNWVEDVFQDYFVHEQLMIDPVTQKTLSSKMYKRTYSVDANGIVKVNEDPTEVVQKVEYVPVEPTVNSNIKPNKEEKPEMAKTKKEKIEALIACPCTRFEEKDREFLANMSEDQLDKLGISDEALAKLNAANAAAEEPPKKPAEAPPVPPKANEEPKPKALTAEEYISAAPKEIQSVLRQAMNSEKAIKSAIIEKLTANKNCAFTKEQLELKPVDELQALAKLAQVEIPEPNFTGNAGTVRENASGAVPPMEKAFAAKS